VFRGRKERATSSTGKSAGWTCFRTGRGYVCE
jgi:hypothetical protein